MCKALGSIPSTAKGKEKVKEGKCGVYTHKVYCLAIKITQGPSLIILEGAMQAAKRQK